MLKVKRRTTLALTLQPNLVPRASCIFSDTFVSRRLDIKKETTGAGNRVDDNRLSCKPYADEVTKQLLIQHVAFFFNWNCRNQFEAPSLQAWIVQML